MGISDRRIQYETTGLDRGDLEDDAVVMLQRWYAEAEGAGVTEPNAMVLGTVDPEGLPDSRVVLARDISHRGIVFYTNRESAKGVQMKANPVAVAVFPWLELHRQVRARGRVSLLADEASDAYFASRPRDSQIGAWASSQSAVLADRAELDVRIEEITSRYEGRDVPRPPHWGGYVLALESVEFWQGRPNRLHDRFRFVRDGAGWRIERLAP